MDGMGKGFVTGNKALHCNVMRKIMFQSVAPLATLAAISKECLEKGTI